MFIVICNLTWDCKVSGWVVEEPTSINGTGSGWMIRGKRGTLTSDVSKSHPQGISQHVTGCGGRFILVDRGDSSCGFWCGWVSHTYTY